jgi:AraC family transcriptional regulator
MCSRRSSLVESGRCNGRLTRPREDARGILMRTHLPVSYGDAFARCFYLEQAPSILMRPLSRHQLAATRLSCKAGLPDPSASVRPEPAFTISVHLTDPQFRGWGTWVSGTFQKVNSWQAGGIGIYDLESDPIAFRPTGFDAVHYNLPRTTLDAFTEDHCMSRVRALLCEQGTKDPVIYHMTQILLPSLGANAQLSDLFFEHFVQMFVGRLVETYSALKLPVERRRRGLARWQMSRARELLDQHPQGDISLARLARECGLSVSQFARSFKQSFGSSAHRYLILQRIEQAKTLLMHSNRGLSEIGLKLGFCDQAAFSRTFRSFVGIPPGKWRAERRARSQSIVARRETDPPTERSH